MIVGYCRCGAPVKATHPTAGAIERTCSGHPLDLAIYYSEKTEDMKPSDAAGDEREEKR